MGVFYTRVDARKSPQSETDAENLNLRTTEIDPIVG